MARRVSDDRDTKIPAQLCSDCGGWPALHRPKYKIAYCDECAKRRGMLLNNISKVPHA